MNPTWSYVVQQRYRVIESGLAALRQTGHRPSL
jgi:hypothetical protein